MLSHLTPFLPFQTLSPPDLAFTQNHLVSVGDSACVFVWRMLRDDTQPAASASNIQSNTSATATTTAAATAATTGGWSAATGAGAPSARSALLATATAARQGVPGMPAPKPTGGDIAGTGFGVLQGPPGTVAGSGGRSVAGVGGGGVEAGPGVSSAAPAAVVAVVAATGSATAAAAAPGAGAGSMWPPPRHSPGAAAGYAPAPAPGPGYPGGVPSNAGYAAPAAVSGSPGGVPYHARSIAAPAVAGMTAPSTAPPLAPPASPPTLGSSLGSWPAAAGQQPSTLFTPPIPAMGPRGLQPAEQCVALVGAPHASTREGMVWRSDMGLFAYCVDSTLVVEDLATRWVCMGSAARCRCT